MRRYETLFGAEEEDQQIELSQVCYGTCNEVVIVWFHSAGDIAKQLCSFEGAICFLLVCNLSRLFGGFPRCYFLRCDDFQAIGNVDILTFFCLWRHFDRIYIPLPPLWGGVG